MPADYRPLCKSCSAAVERLLGLHHLPLTDPRRDKLAPHPDEVRDALLAATSIEHLAPLRQHVLLASGTHSHRPDCCGRRPHHFNFELLSARLHDMGVPRRRRSA